MTEKKPRLLFITQKIHARDDDLAFAILWIKEFIRQGYDVTALCLEKRDFDDSFTVYSLGKERGYGKFRRVLRFLRFILTLKCDRVYVHMNAEYFTLGGWWWFLRRTPMYFWYTHITMTFHVWLAGVLSKRMFAATSQSLPQYEGSPKKIVTGHGIDINFWKGGAAETPTETSLFYINRLSRSKRVELAIRALDYLPREYILTIYGRVVPGEEKYNDELRALAREERYKNRVVFKGSFPMAELRNIYPQYRLMINMASDTIDKAMLEAMLYGVFPIATKETSIAIGLPVYPEDDRPESLARFIQGGAWRSYDRAYLANIVKEKHSLESLIRKMGSYIEPGI